MTDTPTATETLQAAIDALGLTMTAVFVPWSQSRNNLEKQRSLNWIVTIHRDGRAIVTTDYSAGIGHCPSYRQGRQSVDDAAAIEMETETGRDRKAAILPTIADVMYSLASDAAVLDSPTYEDWAGEYGYDADSRKGEHTYRACLELALKLRGGIGDDGIRSLQTASQDY